MTSMPAKLQYCVYVLRSMKDGDFYVGFTTNLARRLTEHFQGQSKSTAPRRPFCLIFCEYFFSKEDAMRREMYLKTTAGRKGLKLILRETLGSEVWRCSEMPSIEDLPLSARPLVSSPSVVEWAEVKLVSQAPEPEEPAFLVPL
jgi:putative endonuclease